MDGSYQAIYDAVRSKISGGNVSDVAERVMRESFDISLTKSILLEAVCIIRDEHTRPSIMLKPKLSIDGDQYCALYGDDIQNGVSGFGATPAEAFADFDENFVRQRVSYERRCSATGSAAAS